MALLKFEVRDSIARRLADISGMVLWPGTGTSPGIIAYQRRLRAFPEVETLSYSAASANERRISEMVH
jgi:hypothetical protein